MLKMRTRKAFTLLELTVAIVVLGILALLAIPTFQAVISGSKVKTDASSATSFGNDVAAYISLNPSTSVATAEAAVSSETTGTVSAGATTGNVKFTGTNGQSSCITVSGNTVSVATTAAAYSAC